MENPPWAIDLATIPKNDRRRFVESVTNGKNNMPPWGDVLKPNDVEALWAYFSNEFLYAAEDPLGERCPLGAHIRRSNPRESFEAGSKEELSIVNRHRILRVGRAFDAAGSGDPEATNPGLLFMCINADIERQFEFIQQTWSMSWQFHGLENEVDPIVGRGKTMGRLTVPSPRGPLHLTGVKDFVRVRGGGYFFMPGRRALSYLTGL